MKRIFFATFLGIIFVSGYGHAQRGPRLTDEQRGCLEGKIGSPEAGVRPNPEQMKSAFEACGIQAPKHGGPGGRHGDGFSPNFTEEQRHCLKEKIGQPGRGDRPSREQMDAALSACGIERPHQGSNNDLSALRAKYAAATTDEEKDTVRESIQKLFYTTKDTPVKNQVRQFLRDNPQSVMRSTQEVERMASSTK